MEVENLEVIVFCVKNYSETFLKALIAVKHGRREGREKNSKFNTGNIELATPVIF